MDNELLAFTVGYVTIRVAVVLAFAYGLFRALRPAPASTGRDRRAAYDVRRANLVPEDRC